MRVAIIGLGSAGARHARLAGQLGHEITGYDPVAEVPPSVKAADSPEAAFAGAGAAIIASPNSAHPEHALAAIAAGVPVLVEKPLAPTAVEARAVAEAAGAAGLPAGMAMMLRFHHKVEELKRRIESGELGEIHFARASFGYDLRKWRPDTDYRRSYSARAELGGGILLDAIHEVDELLWLLGPAESVSARLDRVSDLEIDVEDTALLQVSFASGAHALLDLNFWEATYRRGCLLAGSEATAGWEWEEDDIEPAYRAELADFFAAVESGGEPRTPLAEGTAAVELVEAAKLSAREGRRVEL